MENKKIAESALNLELEQVYSSVEDNNPDEIHGHSNVYKMKGEDEDLMLHLYENKNFMFSYDATPIGTSLYTKAEIRDMHMFLNEHVRPLNLLSPEILKEARDFIE